MNDLFMALGSFGGLFSAVTVALVTRFLKRRDSSDAIIQQENGLILKNLQAIGHLSEATAYAMKEGKVNGRMETALRYYSDARDETNAFLVQQAAAAATKH